MGQVLAIVSSKGGVGKTTTAVNLSAAFASFNFPTLLVEADPQCGLAANFGFDRFEIPVGLADVTRGNSRLEETTYETPVQGLHLVSCNVWTQEEELAYLSSMERDPLVLRQAMETLREAYDYIVIDCPPMTGPITMAVLAAADRFVIPVQTEPHAARSLQRLLDFSQHVRSRCNPGLRFDGVALTMFDSRTRLSETVAGEVRGKSPDQVFSTVIPRHVRLAEIHPSGRPLVVAAPASRGARAYSSLAEEILLKHARERLMSRTDDATGDSSDGVPVPEPAVDLKESPPESMSFEPVPVGVFEGATAPVRSPGGAQTTAEGEWDSRFVDIETFLKMESGDGDDDHSTDDAWDEEWDSWSRDD
jgi:chromosome partitioning protein